MISTLDAGPMTRLQSRLLGLSFKTVHSVLTRRHSAEARVKLSGFQGRSGFGSAEYYGRDETGPGQMERRISTDLITDSASQFVSTFANQAAEDFDTIKNIVSEGSAKLSDMLSDMKVTSYPSYSHHLLIIILQSRYG